MADETTTGIIVELPATSMDGECIASVLNTLIKQCNDQRKDVQAIKCTEVWSPVQGEGTDDARHQINKVYRFSIEAVKRPTGGSFG